MSFVDMPGSEVFIDEDTGDMWIVVPGSPEWYEMWNEREYRKVKRFLAMHGGAYAVYINDYSKIDDWHYKPVVFVRSFEEFRKLRAWPDALIPPDEEKAEKVRRVIEEYRKAPFDKNIMKLIERVFDTIEEVGGIRLFFE